MTASAPVSIEALSYASAGLCEIRDALRALALEYPVGGWLGSAALGSSSQMTDSGSCQRLVSPSLLVSISARMISRSPSGRGAKYLNRVDLMVWFFAENQRRFTRYEGSTVAFSPDSKRLASSGTGVKLWDTTTG